ncbi:MAG: radical SAM protein [Myxococcota bacterium]
MKSARDALRLFDDRPWTAHLYVTDQCNLDCQYCNEYDNSQPHPPLERLTRYLRKIRDLGVVRLGLQGGEPLLHPDIVPIVREAKRLGFDWVSMSSNAFPLTRDLLRDLGDAGLDGLQISVDRMTPIPFTRKSLKTVLHKLDWFEDSPVRLNVAGVLSGETVGEMDRVLESCLERDVPVAARLIHDDLIHDRTLRDPARRDELLAALERQAALKASGARIHSSWNVIAYQRAMLTGERLDWSCVAGYKYFFVSAQGRFWLCSQVRTERDIMDVTPEALRAYDHPKSCQTDCGVYCTAEMSLAVSDPATYLGREIRHGARAAMGRLRRRGARRLRAALATGGAGGRS